MLNQHFLEFEQLPFLPAVIEIRRESEFYVVSSIIPIVFITLLVFPVFFMKRKDLSLRMQYIVTLYLALAASSFFLEKPKSRDPLLPDWLGLFAYLALTIAGLESVLAYYLTRNREMTTKHRLRLLHLGAAKGKALDPRLGRSLSYLLLRLAGREPCSSTLWLNCLSFARFFFCQLEGRFIVGFWQHVASGSLKCC